MVDLYRLFKVDTRTLTNQQHKFAGQVGDAISTRIHFTYEPENILEENDYTPYIMFNIMDCKGRPYVYSPHSKHPFDGYTFAIPWEITSKIKNNRLEYQLLLVRSDIAFDGNILSLGDTEYLLSNMDGIAYKHSVKVSNCGCGGLNPGMEPSLLGWINFWKEHGLIEPVEYERNEEGDGGKLIFRTVGKEPFYVVIPDGKGANDGKTTFSVNGQEIGFTTANQSVNKDIAIPVPKVNNPRIRFIQNGQVIGTITLNQEGDQDIILQGGGPLPRTDEIKQETVQIGNITDRGYTIPHSLDTIDLTVRVRKNSKDGDGYNYVKANTYIIDYSSVYVEFDKPPKRPMEYTVILTTDKVINGMYAFPFGNTVDKEYIITHNLGTMNLVYSIRCKDLSAHGYPFVDAKVYALDENRVKVAMKNPATRTDAFMFVALSNNSVESSYSAIIGGSSQKDYTITHNLGTMDLDYSVRELKGTPNGYLFVDAKVKALDNNRVWIHFNRPPTNQVMFFALKKDE